MFDDDEDSEGDDEDSYGRQYGLIIAAGGANELIQPLMNMEDILLGPNAQDFIGLAGADFEINNSSEEQDAQEQLLVPQ